MKEFENQYEPRMVSYLDVLVYSGEINNFPEEVQEQVDRQTQNMVSLPSIEREKIMQYLWELGVDTGREVEEKYCLHKPFCLSKATKNENKPTIYGLAFFGYLRTDTDFKKFCLEHNINF